LKYPDAFNHTHLGRIGKAASCKSTGLPRHIATLPWRTAHPRGNVTHCAVDRESALVEFAT
jgi:hypothetical protein